MSKIAIGVIILCSAGIGLIINESVEQNSKLNMLVCSGNPIMLEQGPIHLTPEGSYFSRTGKSYVPMPGSICSVETFEELPVENLN